MLWKASQCCIIRRCVQEGYIFGFSLESKHDSFMWLQPYAGRMAGESTLIQPSKVKFYSRMDEEDSDDGYEMAAIPTRRKSRERFNKEEDIQE